MVVDIAFFISDLSQAKKNVLPKLWARKITKIITLNIVHSWYITSILIHRDSGALGSRLTGAG